MTHALEWLRPSSGQRLALCPGSREATRELPELPQDLTAAERGTRIHAGMAEWLAGVLGGPVPPAPVLEADEAETRAVIVARLWHVFNKHGRPVFHALEARVQYAAQFQGSLLVLWQGRTDFAFVAQDGTLHVCDWKTGWAEVPEARVNMQVRIYVCAVVHTLAEAGNLTTCPAEVWGHVLTPRGMTSVCYRPADLVAAREEIEAVWRDATAPDAPRAPGWWCDYCPALGTARCPESGSLTALVRKLDANGLTPASVARVLDMAPAVLEIIKRAKLYAELLIKENPNAVPGWTMEEGTPKRQLGDTMAVWARLQDVLTGAEFAACCKPTLGALEEALRLKIGTSAKGAREELNRRLGDVITKTTPEKKLARMDVAQVVDVVVSKKQTPARATEESK